MDQSGTVVLSRQPLCPSRRNPWVTATVMAVKWLGRRQLSLNTSTGMPTWDMVTALGSLYGLPLNLFLTCSDEKEFESSRAHAIEQFGLDYSEVTFSATLPDTGEVDKQSLWQKRDREIVAASDTILPVSIRPGGYFDSLLDSGKDHDWTIIDLFKVEYEHRQQPLAYRIDEKDLNPDLKKISDKYLVHWTRTSPGPWPDERLIDYYRDIVTSAQYPRSACNTLLHIINTGLIEASGRHMPSNISTVSFSGRPPALMLDLIRWRARYRQMSFEPYGIGINRRLAGELDIRQVEYHDLSTGSNSKADSDAPRWLQQSRGVKSDWTAEEEYRHKGHLRLATIDKRELVLFCHTRAEADRLSLETGIETVPFTLGFPEGVT